MNLTRNQNTVTSSRTTAEQTYLSKWQRTGAACNDKALLRTLRTENTLVNPFKGV
jgi:hypothetical protein